MGHARPWVAGREGKGTGYHRIPVHSSDQALCPSPCLMLPFLQGLLRVIQHRYGFRAQM